MRTFILTGMLVFMLGSGAQAWAATAEDVAKQHQDAINLFKQGKNDAALKTMQEALKGAEAVWGKTDPNTDAVAYDLALIYTVAGTPGKATDLFKRLADDLAKSNPADPRLAMVHYGLAAGLMTKDPKTSAEEYDAALKSMEAQGYNTKEHANVLYIRALYEAGYVQTSLREMNAARKYYSQAVKDSEELFGKDSAIYGQALFADAQYNAGTGNDRKAAKQLEETLDILGKSVPANSPVLLNIHAALVPIYSRLKHSSDATEHLMIVAKTMPDKKGAEQPLYHPRPFYPFRGAKSDEGYSVVSFGITPDGHVKDAKVTKGDDNSGYAKAALKAIETWRYKPRFENGKPVESTAQYRFTYGPPPGAKH